MKFKDLFSRAKDELNSEFEDEAVVSMKEKMREIKRIQKLQKLAVKNLEAVMDEDVEDYE